MTCVAQVPVFDTYPSLIQRRDGSLIFHGSAKLLRPIAKPILGQEALALLVYLSSSDRLLSCVFLAG